ncbi:MAG: bifunctional demethylmenaquinone methyltransferase/2-methoxy-6-polyprenyl-1,4-benzoquinol methylase UbiE [Deltaproteobacteria bacterium]|nr:bifunctional demethylmenaquinone methyltransferase/2-methoxy-6-polyprenyl-1,4-benzoquinol methylase UbiE [Deltaproteobacteria bacterium]
MEQARHQIESLFSEISPTYDRLNHLLSFNIDRSWRRKTIAQIVFDRGESVTALDLCAGTLDLTLEFLKTFPKGIVTAVDFSQSMLDLGAKKIPPQDAGRVRLICADALKLPFPDGQFDLLFCGYGFRNLDDKEAGLNEMRRVLRPGGQLLILEFFRPTNWFTKLFHGTYGNFILPTVGRLISKRTGAYRYLHESISRFYSTDECSNLFYKHMFNSIKLKFLFNGVSAIISGVKA